LYPFELKYYKCLCKIIVLCMLGRNNCYRLKDLRGRFIGNEKNRKSRGYWDVLEEQ